MMMRIKLILFSLLLSSCSDISAPSVLSVPLLNPYKMDIRQGNYITPEMREKLKLGMLKSQVRYLLGTPMISDAFHGNRWDYVYRLERQGEVIEDQRLTLYFEGDNLVKIYHAGNPAP
jgi:outer membrane protein assembly factor BamE